MNRFLATLVTLVVLPLALWGQPKSSNAAAQQAYEEGLAHKKNPGVKSAEKAIQSFQRAVALDPKFAAAHAQVAMVGCALGAGYNYWSPERTRSLSLQAAERAVALDPSLAEAHLAAAWVKTSYQGDWAGAEQSHRQAVSLKSDYADGLLELGFFLANRNRTREADGYFQQAEKIGIPPMLAFAYRVARTADRKELTQLVVTQQRQLEKSPPNAYWSWNLAFASCKARDWANGEKYLLQQIPLMEGDIVDEVALLGHIYGRTGRKAEAMKRLAQLDEIEKSGLYVSPVLRAWVHLGLGEKDRAFSYLDQAMAQRAHRLGLGMKGFDFVYDSVRDDPRFAALLKKMNL